MNLLQVPLFARLDDYVGPWLCEPITFSGIWNAARQMDFLAHMAEPLEQRAAIDKQSTASGKSIGVIRLTGLLMKAQSSMGGTSTIQIRRDIRNAAADSDISAILLAIDSPGGTVAGTSDLADEVKAARKSKPVWAHIDDLGASAAYWIASQCERITANSPTALVGSIGTVQVMQDQSEAAAKEGVKTLVFATGPMKGMGTPGSKVTDEHIAHVQALVDSVQKSFDAAVQKGRSLTDKQLAAVRHGGVFTAEDALKNKLIDAIQPLSKTISELTRSLAGDGRGQVRADAGSAGVASQFPMVQRRRLPVLAQEIQR